jgi:integrase
MKFVQPIRDPKKLDAMKKYLYFKNIRDFIMFFVGINTGFRISDILPLTVRDVKGTHITITEKKTKKVKSVLIRKSLRKALDAYIKNKADFEYLFPSRKRKRGKTQPISPNMAYKIIRGAAKELDLEEIGTHSMIHLKSLLMVRICSRSIKKNLDQTLEIPPIAMILIWK